MTHGSKDRHRLFGSRTVAMGKNRGEVSRCTSEICSCVVRKLCLKSRRILEFIIAIATTTVITEVEMDGRLFLS